MKQLAFTLLAIGITLCSRPLQAQSQAWTLQGANITGSSLFIGDISVVDGNVVWAIAGSYNGGMCQTPVTRFTRTTTGGTKWKSGSIGAPVGYNTWNISAVDSMTAWVSTFDHFNLNNGRVYKTTNGGLSWQHQATANFTSACKFVHFFNANDGVAVGENEVFITSNGGTNWTIQSALPVPYGGPAYFIINSYEVSGNSHIWLGDDAGVVYYSADKGHTWHVQSDQSSALGYQAIKGLAFKNTLEGMAIASVFQGGGNGGGSYTDNAQFYKTSDGGVSWTPVFYNSSQSSLSNQYYAKYDVAYLPGTADSYILSSEYDNLFKFSAITTDGGTTWTYIDSTVAHTALKFAGNGTGWSGSYITNTGDGIYKWGGSNVGTSLADYQKHINEQISILYQGNDVFVRNGLSDEAIRSLTILTLEGKKISTVAGNSERMQKLETASLSKGVYILETELGKSTLHKKFVLP